MEHLLKIEKTYYKTLIVVSVATNGGSNQNLRVGLSVGGKNMKYGDKMELTCGVFFQAVFFIRGETDSVPDSCRSSHSQVF